MTLIRAMAVAISVATNSAMAQAQDNPDHLVTLNTRTFDLGIDVSEMRRDPDFVPMNEIDWLSPILDADPFLGPTVFHLKMTDPSNKTAESQWEYQNGKGVGFARNHVYNSNIPDRFKIAGYDVWSYHEDGLGPVVMIPTEPDADYLIKCDQDRKSGNVDFCLVIASYPPDPLIYLQARHYSPENWEETSEELDDIVARMREIAACLDVTDREIEFNADGQRKLSGCKTGAGM
jgi:hypothetical protein